MKTISFQVKATVGDTIKFHTERDSGVSGKVVCVKLYDHGDSLERMEERGHIIYRVEVDGRSRLMNVDSCNVESVLDLFTNKYVKVED